MQVNTKFLAADAASSDADARQEIVASEIIARTKVTLGRSRVLCILRF